MPCSAAHPKACRQAETASRVAPTVTDGRSYPTRPHLAVSAAIIRDGKVLIVRRARPPAVPLTAEEAASLAALDREP